MLSAQFWLTSKMWDYSRVYHQSLKIRNIQQDSEKRNKFGVSKNGLEEIYYFNSIYILYLSHSQSTILQTVYCSYTTSLSETTQYRPDQGNLARQTSSTVRHDESSLMTLIIVPFQIIAGIIVE